MAIDQATQDLLHAFAANGAPPLTESTPETLRAASFAGMLGPGPDMHSVDDRTLDSIDGAAFEVRVLVPTERPDAVIVYLHGGGWVLGDIDGFDTLGRRLAARTNAAVVLVGYRKAPEDPFPAGLEDTWAALRWVADHAPEYTGRSVPLVLAGDSAGANLAIVDALRARDRGGPVVDGLLLVYPVTDSDTERPSYVAPENQLLLTKDSMEWFFHHYIGDGDRANPEVSPLRASDLSGLPPTAIVVAEHDPLRDEGQEFGVRLRESGVVVDLRLFEGQSHGFFQMVNVLPAVEPALDYLAGFLRSEILHDEGASA